ncbi:MAG: hypothetical protein HRU03_03015, partial [Nanoarchaeales archaeon]|nr:hypothetical protein [Nanoarchaeales archaeon]
ELFAPVESLKTGLSELVLSKDNILFSLEQYKTAMKYETRHEIIQELNKKLNDSGNFIKYIPDKLKIKKHIYDNKIK